jgi:hypothetical protein
VGHRQISPISSDLESKYQRQICYYFDQDGSVSTNNVNYLFYKYNNPICMGQTKGNSKLIDIRGSNKQKKKIKGACREETTEIRDGIRKGSKNSSLGARKSGGKNTRVRWGGVT